MKIYFYTLPALGLCRLGADIERYRIETDVDLMELPRTLEIDYFVPIHWWSQIAWIFRLFY